jgi:hypothetical protein
MVIILLKREKCMVVTIRKWGTAWPIDAEIALALCTTAHPYLARGSCQVSTPSEQYIAQQVAQLPLNS